MSHSDRREYLTATVLDQTLLDRLQDNLEFKLEMVVDIETPTGTIHASDRNKYADGIFYEAITNFPVIKRSIGEWLEPTIEFSRLTLSVSNVDGRYNSLTPGGDDFDGWIGKNIKVKLGLRDIGSSYTTIYSGNVTSIGGFQRDRAKITVVTRDDFDRLNKNFPTQFIDKTSYPDLEDNFVGLTLPIIYGDWTVRTQPNAASVPCYPVNGASATVLAGTSSLRLLLSMHSNQFVDISQLYINRGDTFYKIDTADVAIFDPSNRELLVKQVNCGGTTTIDGSPFQYVSGDTFWVKMRGIDLGAYSDNAVEQARDILKTYGDAAPADFDATWDYYRDKATPSESAIINIKSRVWVKETQNVVQYALSMLEQVRLECFISRELKLRLSSLHFDDFIANSLYVIRNWDVSQDESFAPALDDRNVWNKAKGAYGYDPVEKENAFETAIFLNQASIDQIGKEIGKKVVFPNLYEEATVIQQLQEMLKLASGYTEFIEVTLTARAALRDIGEFVKVNIQMGSIQFNNVPAMIRDIGYDPRGLRIVMKLWSFQMIPFPGYAPGYAGIVGGSTATITQET